MTILLEIDPCAKPRQTRSDKWKKRPSVMGYRAFADEVRLSIQVDIDLNYKLVTFFIVMPKSWSQKKKQKMAGKPHTQRPDIDNLAKALFDALYTDDSGIHTVSLRKVWSKQGMIRIESDE